MYGTQASYDREIADESKAIELDSRLDYAYYNRGEAYLATGSPTNASADFRTAAALIPETDPLHSKALQHIADLEKQAASVPGAVAASERRVALVIGNGAYSSPLMPRLRNPPHDAAVVAATLKGLGFDVDVETDVTKQGMEDAFGRLAREARQADLTLVFYAGHGLQDQGKNYLAPVDATLSDETDLRRSFVRLDDVLGDLADAKGARIVMLDACRDNGAIEAFASGGAENPIGCG
jgi:hypothetical protein